MDGHEMGPALRGPLKTPERTVMASTYAKQEYLDRFITPVSIKDALKPLSDEYQIDLSAFYSKDYDMEPVRQGATKEPVVMDLTEAGPEYDDVRPYFTNQEGRRYYRYIESRYHSDKETRDCHDLLFVEQTLPKGKILAVFEYNDPYTYPVKTDGKKVRVTYRKLKACFAIVLGEKREDDQAIDLTSFWMGAEPPGQLGRIGVIKPSLNAGNEGANLKKKYPDAGARQILQDIRRVDLPEENRVVSIGVVSQADKDLLDPISQMNLLKEKGRLLITDEEGPEKWYQLLYLGSAFSQNEGDKMEAHIRTDLPLGMIRSLLGETGPGENQAVEKFFASALRQGGDLRNILQETRDWIRNRLAVSLYLVRKLHQAGIDFAPTGGYQEIIVWAEGRMKQLQASDARFTENYFTLANR